MATIINENGKARRYCARCGKMMPRSAEGEICPACLDYDLYREVKEYISTHAVTAREVAESFEIPVDKVKEWINKGYIQYRPHRGWNDPFS